MNFTSQGIYKVINREKYIGSYNWVSKTITKENPKYKSSWEERVMTFLDNNKKVIKWGYEIINIPYFMNGKTHKYFLDFYVEVYDKNNIVKKYLLEVKPFKAVKIPKKPRNNNTKAMRRYLYERRQYVQNSNKWNSANAFCIRKGLQFIVLTERQIL